MGHTNFKKPVVLILAFLFIFLLIFRIVSTPDRILSWDVFGYYLYLPAKFIYHDITLQHQEWINDLIQKYQPTATLYQAISLENGNWVMKYSMGMAFIYFPFFIVAHLIALIFNLPADGLSLIYQYTLALGGILIAFIGLIYLTKILLHFFTKTISLIVLLIIVLGTNYFQLTAFEGTLLSHNGLFTLYAILVYYTIRWHQKQKLKYAIIIGLTSGLCTLIRPSEIICVLIPLLWNINNIAGFKEKIWLIRKNAFSIILLIFSFFIVILPQLLYWKSVTGEYLFYSYTNPGEGFEFLAPYTIDFLFSFRKGWIIYTPIMIFSFLGFYVIFKRNSKLFFSLLVFIVLDIYIISSWTCWWYAGASFSSRSMVPAYVILAIPLGYFIEYLSNSRLFVKISTAFVIILLLTLNLFQTWQFEHGIITRDTMTKSYYFEVFGKTSVDQETKKLLLVNRFSDANEIIENESEYQMKKMYENKFDNFNDTSLKFKDCFLMNNTVPYSPGIDMKYKDITNCDHAWIRCSVDVFIPEGYNEESPLIVIHFAHDDKAYKYFTKGLTFSKIINNEWNHLELDYLTPEVRTIEDNLKVYIWYRGTKNIYIDNLNIVAFEPKNQLEQNLN